VEYHKVPFWDHCCFCCIYTDDVDNILCDLIKLYKFADDMKLYYIFYPKESETDAHKPLQQCIDTLYGWCRENSLPLNLKKCCIVHFGSNNPRNTYHFEHQEIAKHSLERDLGVIFDERLTFQTHIDSVVNRARRLISLMFRSFRARSDNVIIPIYKTMIRPQLEYASTVWNPYLLKHVKQIESVQRYVTKRLTNYSLLSYEERLLELKLPSLKIRRDYFDLLEMYKIIKKLSYAGHNIDISFLNRLSRGHAFRIRPNNYRLNTRKSALFVRAVNAWNELPTQVASEPDLKRFKFLLRQHLFACNL